MIDSHCHLADDAFAGDAVAVIDRARQAGLGGALCIVDAGNAVERERASALLSHWPALRCSFGIHPHQAGAWAGRCDEVVAAVRDAIAAGATARAVGEIGLDYHYDFSPREVQREVFAAQLHLALALDLPVVVHSREAEDDTLDVLREVGAGRVRGVLHCFTGSSRFARRALDLGFHISLAGIVTFPKADDLREVAQLVPANRLLVETDSPFLAPVPYRGKRNEPAWVVKTAEKLAALRSQSVIEFADRVGANYEALFRP